MKDKRIAMFILAILSLSAPVFSASDTFTVDYTFERAGDCGEFLVKEALIMEVPGEPLIPYKAAQILLPQNAAVKDIKVRSDAPIVQSGFNIPWGQPACTVSEVPVKVERSEVYTTDSLYPGKMFEVIGTGSFRGFEIVSIHLFPVQYQPKSGTVYFYPHLSVEVQFGKGGRNTLYRGLPEDKEDVAAMVDNPSMVGTYEDQPILLAAEEYIIITNDALQSTFQPLATHKANYVKGATVYTVSWIYSNYSGRDNPEKIRNFIKDKYTNNGTKYVLLGGDIAVVPYRGFYVSAGGYTDYDMAADMYYAHLDGTFNDDGDSYWAEPNDGVDWYAEVAVGRAPCETTTEASNFVNKVISYEKSSKPRRVLLHASKVQSDDSLCLVCRCSQWVPTDYCKDYLLEECGQITKAKWIDAWALGPVAVEHMGHGSITSYYLSYENGGSVVWSNSDVSSMTNTFWPWTTSIASLCGQIEYNDCLAEAYVMDADNGAIAAIYNDNYGWYSSLDPCKYSGEFCEMEFRACWGDGKQKPGEMLNQARSYLVSSAQSDSTYRWCFYERNLVGDPESPCLTKRPTGGQIPMVEITGMTSGSKVCGTVTIAVSTAGQIDEVRFYIFSVAENEVFGQLLYTDRTPPFEYSWNTTLYVEGIWYTIRADGYCSGEMKAADEIIVMVENPSSLRIIV